MSDIFFITVVVILFNLVFILGLFLGLMWSYSRNNIVNQTPGINNTKTASNQITKNPTKIEIDETKFVTKINTDGLEKKYTDIGNKKESDEQISTSINKLKSLKG